MKALVFGRISVAKAGWLIVAFVVAWPVYVLLPFGRNEARPPLRENRTISSKLPAVGLAPNADWEGLAELFAVWSEHAEWIGGKTRFAYWHPGSRAYDYLFEATRSGERIRFRALTPKEALEGKSRPETSELFDLREPSETHPFVFFREVKSHEPRAVPSIPNTGDPGAVDPVKVPVSVDPKGN